MVANMDTTGTLEMAFSLSNHKVLTCLHKFYTVSHIINFVEKNPQVAKYIAVSTGTSKTDIHKVHQVMEKCSDIKWICLDIANGYSSHFTDTISSLRQSFPDKIIIAGNVVTPERTKQVLDAGADLVKLGIGPGEACVTRVKTGIGYPQLSVCLENSSEALGYVFPTSISDGGCKNPCDVAKALGAGADMVMIGGMFAGHDESGGDMFEENGKKYKLFYGMSSDTAMKKHYGKVADYRTSEGKTIKKEYKGPVENTVKDILGGLRSACTYVGAKNIEDFSSRVNFVMV
jgi:GMP reductase